MDRMGVFIVYCSGSELVVHTIAPIPRQSYEKHCEKKTHNFLEALG